MIPGNGFVLKILEVMIALNCFLSSVTVYSKEPSASETVAVDWGSKVASLRSTNPKPVIERGARDVALPKGFSVEEQDRIWGVFLDLCENAEAAWPSVVKHLDSREHCLTVSYPTLGSRRNWSVGDACRIVIGRRLADAYYDKLQPESAFIYSRLRYPSFADDHKNLKTWCNARSECKLSELQAETCAEVVKTLQQDEDFATINADLRIKWCKSIDEFAGELRRSRKAVPFKQFGDEEIVPYFEEEEE